MALPSYSRKGCLELLLFVFTRVRVNRNRRVQQYMAWMTYIYFSNQLMKDPLFRQSPERVQTWLTNIKYTLQGFSSTEYVIINNT